MPVIIPKINPVVYSDNVNRSVNCLRRGPADGIYVAVFTELR